jgi:hypothetical protein
MCEMELYPKSWIGWTRPQLRCARAKLRTFDHPIDLPIVALPAGDLQEATMTKSAALSDLVTKIGYISLTALALSFVVLLSLTGHHP